MTICTTCSSIVKQIFPSKAYPHLGGKSQFKQSMTPRAVPWLPFRSCGVGCWPCGLPSSKISSKKSLPRFGMKAYKRLLEDGLFAFRKIISTCYFPSLNVFVCAILGIFEHFLLSYQWSQPGGWALSRRSWPTPNMSSACHNRMLPIWSQFSLKVWNLNCQSLSPKCFRILIHNCTHVDHVCMHSGQLVSRIHQSSAFLTCKHNIYKCTYMYICTLPQPSITPFKAYVFDGLCYPLLVNLHKSLVLLQCWSCFPHLLAILLVAPIILSGRQKSRMWSSRTCLRSGILR